MKVKNKDLNKIPQKNMKLIYKAVFVVIAVILAEIFIFNFRFFEGLGYKPTELKEFYSEDSDVSYENGIIRGASNDIVLKFTEFSEEVKNIYIDMENADELPDSPSYGDIKEYEKNKKIRFRLKIDDKSQKSGIEMPEECVVSTLERTKYKRLQLAGESHNLELKLIDVANKPIRINSVVLNKGMPFSFNLIRVILLIAFIGILYAVRPSSGLYKYRLNVRSNFQRIVIAAVVVVQIFIMARLIFINNSYVYNEYENHEQYQELAEAIMDGHFYLNKEPEAVIKTLDNPYDYQERIDNGMPLDYYHWDRAYYNGKFYVYFGIVPALIFNIPIKAIFGIEDIMPFTCHLILLPIFVIMSYLLIYALCRRYFSKEETDDEGKTTRKCKVPFILYIMLTELFINCTGTAVWLAEPDMYFLPIFTGLVFSCAGLFFWLFSFRYTDDGGYRLSPVFIGLGSLFMALVSGCRPQMLMGIFLAIPIFLKSIFRDRKLFSKDSIAASLAFVIPVVVFAGFMFFYNYSRFGSIFDFGATYNLTLNDMTSRGIRLGRLPLGIFSYIFQPLSVESAFPYVTKVNFVTKYMGITISEAMYGGILFINPVLWIVVIIPKIYRELKSRGVLAITLMCILFPFIIASADAEMAGILARYYMDFSFFMMLGAVFVIFTFMEKYENSEYGVMFKYFMAVCFVVGILISFAITVGAKYLPPADNNPEMFYGIREIVEFWN